MVAVTCFGCGHPLLQHRQFDICIVDEATQVLQQSVLRALFSAKKFILVGDPDQMPPLVRSSEARYGNYFYSFVFDLYSNSVFV